MQPVLVPMASLPPRHKPKLTDGRLLKTHARAQLMREINVIHAILQTAI